MRRLVWIAVALNYLTAMTVEQMVAQSHGERTMQSRNGMFGTIGHCRLKPGSEAQFRALMDEWKRTIRPTIPGGMLELTGHPADNPDELVFISLNQDEETYRALADSPAQDAWYQRFMELVDGEVRWEDIEAEITLQD
jgi:hypothetical protein